MTLQTAFTCLLGVATLSTALVAGFLFGFSVVVMPGIAKLDDRSFIRAFHVVDGVIQNGQPLFGLVWIGSIVSLFIVSAMGLWQIDGVAKWMLFMANILYIAGVQLPTFRANVPLNNQLQAVDVANVNADATKAARDKFEFAWNRSNHFRTVVAVIVSTLLISTQLWFIHIN